MDAFRTAYVYIRGIFAGVLCETDEGYSFSYDEQYLSREDASAVSLTLPLSEKTYTPKTLFPFFDGLIPEGWLLGVVSRNWKIEDFCQLDLRLTQDKYKGSYERCAKIIERYSSRKGLDMTELYLRLLFSFLVGNSDMHLKNFSLIETKEGSGKYVLSPAYDLLPVNVIMPEDKEQFALTMNGKKTHIRRKDFLVFAEECGMPRSSAEKNDRHAGGEKREASYPVPKFPAAGVPEKAAGGSD